MAGGKETPRQKMIGMMYLVLTALLALNVSKSILDAFVSIEENVQKANATEVFRGNDKRSELIEISGDDTNEERAAKAKKYLEVIDDIDRITAKRIKLIDDVKLEILKECGEDVTSKGDLSIITRSYDAKNAPCTPIRMNLDNVEGKDKYDDPMRVMLGADTDIKKPTGKGLELWKSLLGFRKELTELIASSRVVVDSKGNLSFDTKYAFNAPSINAFKSPKDLNDKILKAVGKSNVHVDDKDVLMEIYRSLSKEEFSTVHDVEQVHWLGKTFDHAPSVAAIASLSSLQRDVLSARAAAIAHIRSRVGGGDFSFNSIMAFANGPEWVNAGDDFNIQVSMVAFDSEKQPRVTMNGETITTVQDGRADIAMKATNTDMVLEGKVAVQNKQGIWKEREWSKVIKVVQPSGSIELPEMNVLYRGHKNLVNASASGFPSSSLTGTNVTITKSGNGYIVTPKSAGTATLIVSGTTEDGKSVQLKRMQFKVRQLPSPQLYWGGEKDGGRVNSSNLLRAQYGPEIPLNVNFKVQSWRASAINSKAGEFGGQGGNLAALNPLKQVLPSGGKITILASVLRPDGVIEQVTGIWTKP